MIAVPDFIAGAMENWGYVSNCFPKIDFYELQSTRRNDQVVQEYHSF